MVDMSDILSHDARFRYQLLSRMQGDCDYYLGYGNRYAGHLWAGNEKDQIEAMKELWNSFPQNAKPEWLSMDDIREYERKMLREKEPLSAKIEGAVLKLSSSQENPEMAEVFGYESGVLVSSEDKDFTFYANNNPQLPYGFFDEDMGKCLASDLEKTKARLMASVKNGEDRIYAIISKQGKVPVGSESYHKISRQEPDNEIHLSFDYFKDTKQIVWSACKMNGTVRENFLEDALFKLANPEYENAVNYFSRKGCKSFNDSFAKDHAYELVYCYNQAKGLIDFDCWTHYEEVLGEDITFEEYTQIDSSYDGDPLEIEKTDADIIRDLRSELESCRVKQMESTVAEQIYNLYDDGYLSKEEMEYANTQLSSITRKYLQGCSQMEQQTQEDLPLSVEMWLMHAIIRDVVHDHEMARSPAERFDNLGTKYNFLVSKYEDHLDLCAHNTDGNWTPWIRYYPATDSIACVGKTDHLNIWLSETRKDMTPERCLQFVEDLNSTMELTAAEQFSVSELIDPEDWQQLADVKDAYQDGRYSGRESRSLDNAIHTAARHAKEPQSTQESSAKGILGRSNNQQQR